MAWPRQISISLDDGDEGREGEMTAVGMPVEARRSGRPSVRTVTASQTAR
jgi:hypothetical protein